MKEIGMKNSLLYALGLSLLLSSSVFAKTFTIYGSVEELKYRPIHSPIKFQYDVIYYVPARLKGKKDSQFTHLNIYKCRK